MKFVFGLEEAEFFLFFMIGLTSPSIWTVSKRDEKQSVIY